MREESFFISSTVLAQKGFPGLPRAVGRAGLQNDT